MIYFLGDGIRARAFFVRLFVGHDSVEVGEVYSGLLDVVGEDIVKGEKLYRILGNGYGKGSDFGSTEILNIVKLCLSFVRWFSFVACHFQSFHAAK